MKIKIKKIFVAALISGTGLSGCAQEPLSQNALNEGVYFSQMAYSCVQKGYISNIPAVALFKSTMETTLNSRVDKNTLTAANAANYKAYNWSAIGIEQCRSLELQAVTYANQYENRQRQIDRSAYSTPQVVQQNTNKYVNCSTIAGITNCISY